MAREACQPVPLFSIELPPTRIIALLLPAKVRARSRMRGAGTPVSASAHSGVCRRVPRQVLEADCMTLYELAVVEGLGDDDVHHRQCERRVGAGTDDEGLVGLPEGFGAADVDRDHAGTPAAGGVKAWARVGLARQVGAPEQYQLGV